MTCDLSNYRGDLGVELKARVLDKVAAHTSKVNRGEKVLQIDVENIVAVPMQSGIANDGAAALKAMSYVVLSIIGKADRLPTVLEKS